MSGDLNRYEAALAGYERPGLSAEIVDEADRRNVAYNAIADQHPDWVEPPFGGRLPSERELLPADPAERKGIPIASGVLDYFPAALAEIAKVSKAGNDQHNPGEPLHWARGKSMDQADTIIRHFMERGTIDKTDGLRHSAKLAWRALALLQLELEAAGYPVARGAR